MMLNLRRRQFIAATGTAAAVAIAGCSDDAGQEAMAENVVEVVDDELGVLEWNTDRDSFYLEYATSDNPGHDIQVVGGAYAGGVDAGLDMPLDGVAVDAAADETAYWVDVEVEWAEQFMADEISEDEYLDRIADTIE